VLSAGDRTLARDSLVRLSDFPAGWTAAGKVTEGKGTTGLTKTQAAHLTSCLKVPASDIDTDADHWTSPSFSDTADAITVDDDVAVYPTVAKAAADYSTFSDPRTPGCLVNLMGPALEQQIGEQLQPGQRLGAVSSGSRPLGSYGTRSGDIELVVPIIEGSKEVPVYVDVIAILEGRVESTLTASSPGAPLPSTLGGQLAQAAATRMKSFR